jgi:membrane protein DedA with SNARE-associated domain
LVIIIGVASAIIGDNVGYLLGRKIGREVLSARGPLHRHRLEAIAVGDEFFAKHGPKAVFLARWIALVRFAAAWLAGINRMPIKQFFFWNALGGLTWGITFGLAGYYGGKAAAGVLEKIGIAGAVVLGLMLIASIEYMRRRLRRVRKDESR